MSNCCVESSINVGRRLWDKWSKIYKKDFSEATILSKLKDEEYQAIGDTFLTELSDGGEDTKIIERNIFEMFCIEHFQISFVIAHKVRYLVETNIIKEKRVWLSFLSYDEGDYMAKTMIEDLNQLNPERDFRVVVSKAKEGFKVDIKCNAKIAPIYENFDLFSDVVEDNIKNFRKLYENKVLKTEVLNAG